MDNKAIPMKTGSDAFNPADFIQTECGTMKEITVAITLAEYRQLLNHRPKTRRALTRIWRRNSQQGYSQQPRQPVNVQPPQTFDGFQDMPGSGGQDNPFTQRPAQPQPSAYQQAGLWDDMNDGELPF